MSITVYFIGGSRDLSKQVLDATTPPTTIEYAKMELIPSRDPFAGATDTQLDREVYRLRGPAYSTPRGRDVWIYAYEGA